MGSSRSSTKGWPKHRVNKLISYMTANSMITNWLSGRKLGGSFLTSLLKTQTAEQTRCRAELPYLGLAYFPLSYFFDSPMPDLLIESRFRVFVETTAWNYVKSRKIPGLGCLLTSATRLCRCLPSRLCFESGSHHTSYDLVWESLSCA